MKIANQVFLIVVASILVSVIAMAAFFAFNLERGFVGYINAIQLKHLEALQKAVTQEAEQTGSIDRLRDRRLWNRFLRETEDGNVPRDVSELRLPPPPRPLFAEDRPRPPPRFAPEDRPPGPPFPPPEERRGRPPPPPADPLGLGRQFMLLDAERRPAFDAPLPPAGSRAPVERAIEVNGRTIAWIRHHPFERVSRPEDLAFLREQFAGIGLVALGLVLAGLFAAPLVARRWTRRLRDIGAATERIARGEFAVRLPAGGGDEIGALAGNVNAMGRSLEGLEEARRRWLAESAHELRTPLAVLRGEIEALQDGVRPFDAKAVASLAEESRHLTKLVDDLHTLAVADMGGLNCVKTRIDLAALGARAAERFRARAAGRGLALENATRSGPVWIEADDDRIGQVLDNLLENSVRYTDGPGRIRLAIAADAGLATITVEDSAPGVRPEECERLFEPLYRADRARSRREGASGLGLAIARAIVKAHGGEIRARPSGLGGLAVTVALPRGSTAP